MECPQPEEIGLLRIVPCSRSLSYGLRLSIEGRAVGSLLFSGTATHLLPEVFGVHDTPDIRGERMGAVAA
jgi:hypothetical protein